MHPDLLGKVEKDGSTLANYSYLSDGTKLSATDGNGKGLASCDAQMAVSQRVIWLGVGDFTDPRLLKVVCVSNLAATRPVGCDQEGCRLGLKCQKLA